MRRAASVIRTTLRNRDLRWVVLGYGLFSSTEFAVWIAMLVYAFQQGGTTAAGVVALVQLVPAAIFAPSEACSPIGVARKGCSREGTWLRPP